MWLTEASRSKAHTVYTKMTTTKTSHLACTVCLLLCQLFIHLSTLQLNKAWVMEQYLKDMANHKLLKWYIHRAEQYQLIKTALVCISHQVRYRCIFKMLSYLQEIFFIPCVVKIRYEAICWLSSFLTTELCITESQYRIIMSWWFCWKIMNDYGELLLCSICYSTISPMLQLGTACCSIVALPDGCAVTTDSGTEPVHHHQTAPDNNRGRPVG